MARKAPGGIIEPKDGRGWAIRFRAYGKRRLITLGTTEEGWNRQRVEVELRHVLADVERGIWQPHEPAAPQAPAEVPTFHEFASEWFEVNRHGWAERTVADYRWALSHHLLPHFAKHRLTAITVEEVDRFRAAKLREGKLGPAQINKCLKRLSQILEVAEEYGHIPRNPARGKRRRVKEPKVRRSWVEPEQCMTLIEASSRYMWPIVATLIGCGLRVGEAVALEWPDINLATGTIRVGDAKTDAGTYREVDLPAGVVEVLTEWKLRSERLIAEWQRRHPSEAPVFLTLHAGEVRRQSEANVSRRLKTSIRRANETLEKLGVEPISERVTPHSLRRSYASIRAASGDDPLYVSEQMGHKDVRFTLNVYSKAVKRRAKLSGVYLMEFEKTLAWAALPTTEWAATGSESGIRADRLSELPSDLA